MSSKVEVVSVESIRPSSPTPHLRTFQFSQWDLLNPPEIYSTFVFFYGSHFDTNQNADSLPNFFHKSRLLKVSLSKTLVHYYPFAGRFMNGDTAIDCNDEGAPFVEARLEDNLSSFLNKPVASLLSPLTPEVDASSVSKAILLLQLTHFSCGGMAVTIYIAHRVADAFSVCTFIKSWISIIHGDEKSFKPIFLEPSSSPPNHLPLPDLEGADISGEFVINRFVFSVPKIEALKAILSETIQERQNLPSNVNIALAIIMKSLMAAHRLVSGTFIPTVLIQLINMRKRLSPAFPDNTIGNILWSSTTVFEEDGIDISSLVRAIRRSTLTKLEEEKKVEVTEIRAIKRSNLIQSDEEKKVKTTEKTKKTKIYAATSLCKFPIYDTDFGWGKPLWAVCTPTYSKNVIILMDTREGEGIEAWICLDEKEMAIFERQKEIQAFASVNPSVVVNHSRI